MPATQNTAKQRLFTLGASRMPHSAKPSQDLRTHGGKVKGPGTPTSDSIEAKLSTDEFVLPADTTRKVGVERLRKLVALTHKPTGKAKKPHHYADGGPVEDEEKKNQTAALIASDPAQSAAPSIPEPAPTPMAAPKPSTIAQGAQGPQQPSREELIAQIPIDTDRKAPATTSEPGFLDSMKQTEFGRQAYNTMMALPGLGGFGRVATTGGAISNGINRLAALGTAASNVVAGDGVAQETASAMGDYVRNFPVGEAQAGTLPDSGVKPFAEPVAAVTTGAETVTSAADESAAGLAQIGPGIYQHGRGQYSDSADGMGMRSGFTGQPSAQNMAAAERLAGGRSLVRQAGVATGGQAAPMRTPTVAHSGNDWTSREALRRAKMDASSIIHQSHWAAKGSGKAAQDRYTQMLQGDMAAQAQQGNLDAKAMLANAELQREAMSQAGANSRDARRLMIDLTKLSQDGERLGMDAKEQSLRMRGLGRADALQEQIFSAQTPEQMSSARARLQALNGRSDVELPKWKSAYDGSGNPFLFDEKTGATMPIHGAQPQVQAKEGSYVRGPDGRQYQIRDGVRVPVGGAK